METAKKVKVPSGRAAERKLLRMKARKQAKALRKKREREIKLLHKSTEELFEILNVGKTL